MLEIEKQRIAKVMAHQGLCSRREAEEYILRGWVRVDGVVVTECGTKITPNQVITLDMAARKTQAERVTILINKPIGYVSAQAENGYQPAVTLITAANQHLAHARNRVFDSAHLRGLAPAGRLDIDSQGLLILTQDGRIAKQIIGENSGIEKEYLVRVTGKLAANGIGLLRHGLALDGVQLRRAQVEWLNADQLRFVLREGRKRQIRRMCELVGLEVVGLKRIRVGNIKLGDLPVGKWRYLGAEEHFD